MLKLISVSFLSISLILIPFQHSLKASPLPGKALEAAKEISRINSMGDLSEFKVKDNGRFEDVGFPDDAKKRKRINKLARKLSKKMWWSEKLNPTMAIMGVGSAIAVSAGLVFSPILIPLGLFAATAVYTTVEAFGAGVFIITAAAGGAVLAGPPIVFILGATTHLQKKKLSQKLLEALQLGVVQSKDWKGEKWKKISPYLTATKAEADKKTDLIFLNIKYGQTINITTLLSQLGSYKGMDALNTFKLELTEDVSNSDLEGGQITRIQEMQTFEAAKVYQLNEVSTYNRDQIADKPSLEFTQGIWVLEVKKI